MKVNHLREKHHIKNFQAQNEQHKCTYTNEHIECSCGYKKRLDGEYPYQVRDMVYLHYRQFNPEPCRICDNCLTEFWAKGLNRFCSVECKTDNHMRKIAGKVYKQHGPNPFHFERY